MSLTLLKSTFKLRIAHKLPLFIIGAALTTALAIGITNYMSTAKEMEAAANEKLSALMESRRQALTDYLSSIEQDMRFQATNPYVYEALTAYKDAWDELGADQGTTLQRLYIENNPHPTGQKENLDEADDGSTYSQAHGSYHPWFRQFLRERDYYDIFLFDLEGNLVYTVFKELDYATNLMTGEWKDSDLGNAFRAARDNPQTGSLQFFDFKPYAPSHGAAASFISTPIHGPDGNLAGVLVFQMPINRINAVMQISAGMGESGETYIVGADKLMRSDSRFSEESTILKTKVDGETVRLALSGKTGAQEVLDYRGISVLSGYGPLEFQGVTWAILAEVDTAEALAAVGDMRDQALIIGAAILVIVTLIGIFLARGIARPIANMNQAMRELAEGNKDIEIPALGRADEIGDMAEAVQVFKDNMIKTDALAAEQTEERAEKEEEAKRVMELCAAFDQTAASALKSVASAATEMQSISESMSATAEQTNRQAGAVATASEQATANVQTVATATEEMSSSIGEIGRQVEQSATIAQRAVAEAEKTNGTVQGLAEAAEKIGAVVEMIAGIAEQTNLLALNATIEAARAGDAGKGFAVVASEVKSLANQTAKATEEIGQQISDMQSITGEAVEAIGSIGTTITEVDEIATAIAAAVEEQGAATQEIARNVQEAAKGTQEVTNNITGVSDGADETGKAAKEVLESAGQLSQQSEDLRVAVDKFLADIKAA